MASKQAQFSPGGKLRLLLYPIEIGREAAVVAVAQFFLKVAVLLQIFDGSLDGGAGEAEVSGYGFNPWPAFALGGRHTAQVHVYRLSPVRDILVGIDNIEVTNDFTPYVLMRVAGCSSDFRFGRSSADLFLSFGRCFSRIAYSRSSRPA